MNRLSNPGLMVDICGMSARVVESGDVLDDRNSMADGWRLVKRN